MNKFTSTAAVLIAVAAIISSTNAAAASPKPPAPAASAASAARVVHHDADATKAKLKSAKDRGSLMSACQTKAADGNLHDIERKDFLTACMAGK